MSSRLPINLHYFIIIMKASGERLTWHMQSEDALLSVCAYICVYKNISISNYVLCMGHRPQRDLASELREGTV